MHVIVTARDVPGFSKNPVEMELPTGGTVADVMDLVLKKKTGVSHGVRPATSRNVIATVNGRYVPVSEVDMRVLADGDSVTLMPLVVGG